MPMCCRPSTTSLSTISAHASDILEANGAHGLSPVRTYTGGSSAFHGSATDTAHSAHP